MGGSRRWVGLILGTGAFALLMTGGVVHGQQADEVSTRAAADLFARARPHLEAVLGTPLEASPQFRPASRWVLKHLPDPDLEAQLRWRFADLDREGRGQACLAACEARASATMARYLDGTCRGGAGTVLVVPGQEGVIAAWDGALAAAKSPAFLQLALVHEVVRGLLDRRYDLARRLAACQDAEEYQVLRALEQGRAQWVTREVARRLGTEACFPLLAERLRHVPDATADPGLRLVSQTALRQDHWAHVQGLAFFTYLDELGWKDAEARAFGRPPRQARWIEQPELYVRAQGQTRPALATLLTGVEQALPAAQWQAAQHSWTPEMVAQVAGLMGQRDRAEKVLSAWVEGRSLVWTRKGGSAGQVALSVVRLNGPAGARSYYGLAVDLQRKRDELTAQACGGQMRVLEARADALRLPGVDEGARFDKRVQFGTQAPAIPTALILARAGDTVLELSWHGLEADYGWAQRVIDAFLAGGHAP
jgi:hypothetical protein